jgi:hypothetical protein
MLVLQPSRALRNAGPATVKGIIVEGPFIEGLVAGEIVDGVKYCS